MQIEALQGSAPDQTLPVGLHPWIYVYGQSWLEPGSLNEMRPRVDLLLI